ncbi:TM0106 family RecB-like putative nuclease [Rhodococcus sp. HNM0569]|nr:TM0106 family RecB-like putative nuclease [Rhodococcus sp. HNM0569]
MLDSPAAATGTRIVYSATDLAAAASCEFGVARRLGDALWGSADPLVTPAADPMLRRTTELGAEHERRVLARFRAQFGNEVTTIARPEFTAAGLDDAADATRAALTTKRPAVVYQGAFYDGRLVGFCDFLVREGEAWTVYDAKLSRHVRVPALLQLAAYVDALGQADLPVSPHAGLVLGDGAVSMHDMRGIVPVYRTAREHLERLVGVVRAEGGPVEWNDPRFSACGVCERCVPEVERHRDVALVAGIRATQRDALLRAGVRTLDALATRRGEVPGLADRTLTGLRAQADLQLRQDHSGVPEFDVHTPAALAAIPAPDAGDLFFDFEGDPLWTPPGDPSRVSEHPSGLEYLFGVVEADTGAFVPFWAHDRQGERAALVAFLDYVADRRRRHPRMHIHHYAAYERSALLRLAGRHGVGEDEVDTLLRAHVLVDLYPVVRAAIRVGARSYSIKKLEPLYMPEHPREGDVVDAAASVVAYADYCALRDAGRTDDADALLASIAAYNEYDCVSTRRLRDWLLALAAERGVTPHPAEPDSPVDTGAESDTGGGEPESADVAALRAFAGAPPRTAEQEAAALSAAAVDYHRRERKPFWWAHFDRLRAPLDEWADTRDVFCVQDARVETPWHKNTPRQRKLRRLVRLTGRFGTGSTVGPGATMYALYDPPAPAALAQDDPALRATSTCTVVSVDKEPGRGEVVTVEELLSGAEYDDVPIALTPGPPIATERIEEAIACAAHEFAAALPVVPRRAAFDVLARRAPRLRASGALPAGEPVSAITTALHALDDSYVAVQGPPGTGKTYTGSRVVHRLVDEYGWRVGVVAQSHSVVENMLDAVVRAGVSADAVGKKDGRSRSARWMDVASNDYAGFLERHHATGCVLGGTAWDFANSARVPPGSLDLLVIDEAGQFSLAGTIAVAQSARNLLLLGDPQQLPQVSQGTHPEPVDGSALGWLTDGHGALPPRLGYFLDRSWRMHPALCAAVSELSYDGRLHAQVDVTGARHLNGLAPGVHAVPVAHRGNATRSAEESREVVRQVRGLLGRAWTDAGDAPSRPIAPSDLLVVAPYNAQVLQIERDLRAAGLGDVEVGTVDRFQGRESPVVIVSMAASAPEDVPRGLSFLLSRNRLNVAVSRGQWAAIVVHSPALTRYLPGTPEALGELGAFLRLTGHARPA